MRVLITGATGMLGQQVTKEFSKRYSEVFSLDKTELNITDYKSIEKTFSDIKPQLVINCAAYTNVDGAETERDLAFTVNGLAPRLLANICRQYNSSLAHISTDYIFNGQSTRPYLITDQPDPINTYGASKLMGEQGIRESGCSYYIIRTSWLFGPGGKHFVDTILKLAGEREILKVVCDQHGSPTYTPDLAQGIADLTGTGIYGTYHYTNTGTTTWYSFARKIIEIAGLKTKVEPCSTSDFPRPARRPANSAMDPLPMTQILKYSPPSWESAVEDYIKNKTILMED